MTFKILPKTEADKRQRYTDGKGLTVVFWRACAQYATIYHDASGMRIGTDIRRSTKLGSIAYGVKDVLAVAEKISALMDWNKSGDDVSKACVADDLKILKQIQSLLDTLK
jgi:hypothetical protein